MAITNIITKQLLDSYYVNYNRHLSSKDPIWNVKQEKTDSGKELIAFITSCYCYGNIVQINKFIDKVISHATGDIYSYLISFKRSKKLLSQGFRYRFNSTQDFFDLMHALSVILKKYGSLKGLFLKYYSPKDENIIKALGGFTSDIRKLANGEKTFEYLVPDIKRKSTCKRLFLFLRWMVRKDNVDTGLWNRDVHASKLVMPVDTHVYRIARKYELVKRKSLDLKFALELTERLKEYDLNDPVKYDFALCHLGVDKVNFV